MNSRIYKKQIIHKLHHVLFICFIIHFMEKEKLQTNISSCSKGMFKNLNFWQTILEISTFIMSRTSHLQLDNFSTIIQHAGEKSTLCKVIAVAQQIYVINGIILTKSFRGKKSQLNQVQWNRKILSEKNLLLLSIILKYSDLRMFSEIRFLRQTH